MDVLWSLTCASVELSLFQDNDPFYSITRRVNCQIEAILTIFRGLYRNLQNVKNHFIEAKIYENVRIGNTTPKSVSTSTWQCVTSSMKNVTNATFNFETSPNTKPKEKKVGGQSRNQPQIFERKSISRNITHRQSLHLIQIDSIQTDQIDSIRIRCNA